MPNKGLLILLSGPSGSGKGTVREALMAQDTRLRYSVSVTTRPPRPGERDGVDYYFLSREAFLQCIERDEFLEYTEYLGQYYGTLRPVVEAIRQEGRDVLLEIETKGAQQVMKKSPDCLSFFILPPSIEELRRRLATRGTESNEEQERRMASALQEMEDRKLYNHVVMNENVEKTAREILLLIEEGRRAEQAKQRSAQI